MLFKVLRGSHTVPSNDPKDENDFKFYTQGDEIESDIDLVAKFGSEKFGRLYEKEVASKKVKKSSNEDSSEKNPKKSVRLKKKETADAV